VRAGGEEFTRKTSIVNSPLGLCFHLAGWTRESGN